MKCYGCNNEISQEDYCVCLRCKQKCCPSCAEKRAYVCDCGGDLAYLS